MKLEEKLKKLKSESSVCEKLIELYKDLTPEQCDFIFDIQSAKEV